jgi:hypothetical protein
MLELIASGSRVATRSAWKSIPKRRFLVRYRTIDIWSVDFMLQPVGPDVTFPQNDNLEVYTLASGLEVSVF